VKDARVASKYKRGDDLFSIPEQTLRKSEDLTASRKRRSEQGEGNPISLLGLKEKKTPLKYARTTKADVFRR
jgi:hypothetical protein